MSTPTARDLQKAAQCGEPSYVWRAGQRRRFQMILEAAGERSTGLWLENGCGVGMYVEHLSQSGAQVIGLEYDFSRASQARQRSPHILCAAGEGLPFGDGCFDMILSHEVLEHVQDDRQALAEMGRVLKVGGRLVLFVPNRGYPFETHGIFWRGRYRFGNIPLVNYLPRRLRDQLAPHVRVYSTPDLQALFHGLPFCLVHRTVIFGAYDNIIQRSARLGQALRAALHLLERTPLRSLGLSHFWVAEKIATP
jgi:SAM-dependent methyltransferase